MDTLSTLLIGGQYPNGLIKIIIKFVISSKQIYLLKGK